MGVLTPLMFMPPCAFTLLHNTPRTVQRSVNPIPSITQTPLVSLQWYPQARAACTTPHWHTMTCQCTHLRSEALASVSKSWHPSATVVVETRSTCQQQGAGAVSTPASETGSKLSCLSHSRHSPPLLTTAARQRCNTRCKPSSQRFSTHINGVACHVSHTSTCRSSALTSTGWHVTYHTQVREALHHSHQRGGMSRITHKYVKLFITHIHGVACHVSHTST
jgi:hypothetical protein